MANISSRDSGENSQRNAVTRGKRLKVSARVLPDGKPIVVQGRDAWMLQELIGRGERGCSSLEYPGRRISHYVLKLRRAGFVIETADERHEGAWGGIHGRYRLQGEVEVLDEQRAAA